MHRYVNILVGCTVLMVVLWTLPEVKGDLRLVCVFYPALMGTEVHQPDGSYAATEDT